MPFFKKESFLSSHQRIFFGFILILVIAVLAAIFDFKHNVALADGAPPSYLAVSSVPTNAKVKLISVNNVYYMAFSSSTGANYYVYLTTSTNGTSWSAPVAISDVIWGQETNDASDPEPGIFAFAYNQNASYFGFAAYATGTGYISFTTSTNGVSWSNVVSVNSVEFNTSTTSTRRLFLDFSPTENFMILFLEADSGSSPGSGFYSVATSTNGTTWNLGTIASKPGTASPMIGGVLSGSGVGRVLHAAYWSASLNDIVYASSTDNGASWSTTTVAADLRTAMSGTPHGTSLAVDGNGRAGLFYLRLDDASQETGASTSTVILNRQNADYSWTTSTIDSPVTAIISGPPRPFALTFYNTNYALMGYFGNNANPKFAVYDGSYMNDYVTTTLTLDSNGGMSADYNSNTEYGAIAYVAGGQIYVMPSLDLAVAPITPTNLAVTPTSTTQINLTWDAVSNADTYTLYRATSSEFTATTTVTTTALTSYSDTGLTASTTYYYKILAVNAVGTSTLSSAVNTTTLAEAEPFVGVDLPILPTGAKQHLLEVNGVYYLAFTSSTGSDWNMYITTSTSGAPGTWNSPTLINNDVVKAQDGAAKDFGFVYNESAGFFGIAYQVTSTGSGYFATSSLASSWSNTTTIFSWPATSFSFDFQGAYGVAVVTSPSGMDSLSFVEILSTDYGVNWSSSTPTNIYTRNATGIGNGDNAVQSVKIGTDNSFHTLIFTGSTSGITPELIYASSTDNGSSWTTSSIATELNDDTDYLALYNLSLDGNNDPGVVYTAGESFLPNGDMFDVIYSTKFIKYTNGSWSNPVVIAASSTATISGLSGKTALQFVGDYPLALYAATNYSPEWAVSTSTSPFVFVTSSVSSTPVDDNTSFGLVYVTSTDILAMSIINNVGQLYFVTSSLALPPSTPTSLTATPSTSTQIDLTWDSTDGATSYVLYRDTNSGFTATTTVTTTALTSYSDTGLTASTQYYYKILATNAAGTSTISDVVSTTTSAEVTPYDGNLPAASADSITDLFYANSQYYLFFSSSTNGVYNEYLTTSTAGIAGTWSEPTEVFSGLVAANSNQRPVDVQYNTSGNYFGLMAFATSSVTTSYDIVFTTSTNGVNWSTTTTVLNFGGSTNPEINFKFLSGTNIIIASYRVGWIFISTNGGSTWSANTLGVAGITNDTAISINVGISGTADNNVMHVGVYYAEGGGNVGILYASSTNGGLNWSTSTVLTDADLGFEYGSPTKMVIDSNGLPGFVYYNVSEEDPIDPFSTSTFSYIHKGSNGTWTSSTIESNLPLTHTNSDAAEYYTAFDYVGASYPLVFYAGANNIFKLAVNTSTSFSVITVTSTALETVFEPSLAYNTSAEVAAMVYVASGQLYFATTTVQLPPSTPTGLTATPSTTTQIDLTWNSTDGATSYVLYRDTNSGFTATTTVTTTALTSYSDTGLTVSTQYYYKVVAVNAVGTSTLSSAVNTTTLADAPAYDGNLPAVPGNQSNTKLLYVNNLYYLFFTSTTVTSSFNLYLTTSTNGVAGTWSQPQIIFSEMPIFQIDNWIATFDAEYDSYNNYLAFTAIASSTGQVYFATSSNGISWNQYYTGVTSSQGLITGLTFASGTNFAAIGYDFSTYVYTFDNWTNVTSTNLPTTPDGELILGVEAFFPGSGDPELQFVYGTINNPTSDFIFVSTTDYISYSPTTTLRVGNDGGLWTNSMSVDSEGNAGFLYYNSTDQSYKFLYNNNGSWSTSTFGSGAQEGGPALLFFNSAPYLMYSLSTANTVNFAYSTSSPYSFTVLSDIGSGAVTGHNNRMSLIYDDNTNVATVVYPSASNTLVFVTTSVDLAVAAGSAPTTPSGLATSTISTSTAVITWTDSSNNEDGFVIYGSTNGSDYTQVGSAVANATSTTVNLPTPNTYLWVKVVAYNSFGTSTDSNVINFYSLPDTPTAPTLGNATTSTIDISLNADNNPTSTVYIIYETALDQCVQSNNTLNNCATAVSSTIAGWATTTIVGLTTSTNYYFQAYAMSADGNSNNDAGGPTSTIQTSAPAGSAPTAPSGAALSSITTSSMIMDWADASSDEDGFTIEYTNDDVSWTFGGTVASNVTSSPFTDMVPNKFFRFRVAAYNSFGTSTFSTTTGEYTDPVVPGTPTISSVSTSSLTVSWTDNSNTSGTVYYVNYSGGSTTTLATSTSFTGLTPNTEYQFAVRAQYLSSSTLYTSYSATSTTSTLSAVPSTPTGLTATPVSPTQIDVAWNSSAGADSYNLYASLDNISYLLWTTTTLTSYSDDSCSPGDLVYYKVSALNAYGESASSTAVSTSTPASTTTPNAPTNLIITNITTSSMTLNWTDNSNDETGFVLKSSPDGENWTLGENPLNPDTGTLTMSNLTSNQQAWWAIAAINAVGTSTFVTSTGDYTNPVVPNTPTISNVSTSSVTVTWGSDNNQGGVTTYYISYNGGFVTSTGSIYTTVTGLTPNTEYTFAVRAQYLSSSTLYTSYSASSTPTTTLSVGSIPSAPSSITVTNITTSTMIVSWTDNSNDEDGFALDYSLDGEVWFLGSTSANTTSTLADAEPNQGMYFRVAAFNSFGTSTYVTTTGDYFNPDIPGTPTISNVSTSSLTATWSDNLNVPGTVYYVNYNGGFTTTTATSTGIIGLTPNTEYQFAVRAQYLSSSTLYTAYSASSTATTTIPVNVTSPVITSVSTSTLTVGWTDGVNGGTPVYQVSGDNDFTSVTTSDLSKALTGLTPNTSYTFTVKVQKPDSTYTTGASATATTTNPNIPGTPSASANGQTSMIVSWGANSNPSGTIYQLYNVTTDAAFGTTTATSTTVTGLTANTSYQFKVRAQYLADNVTYSSYSSNSTGVSTAAVASTVAMTLSTGASSTFQLSAGGTAHTATLNSITNGAASVTIASIPVTVSLTEGQSDNIDTDGNGADDMTVTMTTVGASSATFSLASYTPTTNNTGGGGGAMLGTTKPTLTSFTINNGAKETTSSKVTLNIKATNAHILVISNSDYFNSNSFIAYNENTPWTLTSGNGLKTVYVRLRSVSGGETLVSQNITLAEPIEKQLKTDNSKTNQTTKPENQETKTQPTTYQFTKLLSYGVKGEEVKQLQIRLQALGYLDKTITPTFNFGPATKAAVIKLQKEHKLTPAAGYTGPATRAVLNQGQENIKTIKQESSKSIEQKPVIQPSTYQFTKLLSYGMKGEDVKQLQIRLQALGYLDKTITPTLNFGPATRAAVIKLQKEHKLTPAAGYTGPATRAVLNQ